MECIGTGWIFKLEMSGKQYVFGAVDIANWEFSGGNQATKVKDRNFLLSSYADFGMDG